MLTRLHDDFTAAMKAQRSGIEVAAVSNKTISMKPNDVAVYLRQIAEQPILQKHRGLGYKWDAVLLQIKNVCERANFPLADIEWENLVGRLGHVEIHAWLYSWKIEVIKHLKTTPTTSKFHKIYTRLLDVLRTIEPYELSKNLTRLADAFDVSSLSIPTARLALNCMIKQFSLWCPVFVSSI